MGKRDYSGGASPLVLSSAIGTTEVTFTVEQIIGTWPTGSLNGSLPFFIVIDRGQPNEEKILVRDRAGAVFNIMAGGRGQDDTVASTHSSGATVEHVWTAVDAREVNTHVNATQGVHGIAGNDTLVGEDELTTRLAAERVITDADILAETNARITDVNQEQSDRVADVNQEQSDRIAADADLTAKGLEQTPVGAMMMWPTQTAPTGWFLCRGQSVLRADYPELFAVIGSSYGAVDGSHFTLPNITDRLPRGMGSSDAINSKGGADTVTLGATNLPAHTHSINHDHASSNTTSAGTHGHSVGLDNMSPGNGSGYSHLTVYGDGETNNAAAMTDNGAHTHAVNLPSFAGTSGSTGPGNAVNVQNQYININFIIRNRP